LEKKAKDDASRWEGKEKTKNKFGRYKGEKRTEKVLEGLFASTEKREIEKKHPRGKE